MDMKENSNNSIAASAFKSGQFFGFVAKEFLHIRRDKRTLFILLVMPIVQILIFGFALTNEVKNSAIAVLDQAKDNASQELIREIDASKYFSIVADLKNATEIEPVFKKGKVKMVIVFPTAFSSNLRHQNKAQVQFITDASDPNLANTMNSYVNAIIMDYQNKFNHDLKLPYTIKTEYRMLYNPQLKGAYSFVPGVMSMVLMLICTMMTAITIVKEKELGTMEIMLVSPVKPLKIVVAKAMPYLLLSIVNISTILLLSVFVLNVPINGNIALLIAESILFTITCLSLGLLISTATNSQQTAMFISLTAMFLPTVMLSGFMFPIENMPLPLQVMSNIVPAKWFYFIVKSIMIKGVGFVSVWRETLILLGMTAFFLVLSIKKFKIRLG